MCCLHHAVHVCGDIIAEVLAALSIHEHGPHAAISHITRAVQRVHEAYVMSLYALVGWDDAFIPGQRA